MKAVLSILYFLFGFVLLGQTSQEYFDKIRPLRFANPDSAELLIKKALAKLDKKKDKFWLCRFHNYYGTVEYARGNVGKSDSLYQISLKYADICQVDSFKIFTYNNLGQLYFDYGTFEQANDFYLKALKIAIEKKYNYLIADTYNNLGTLNMFSKRDKESADYFQKGIDAYKQPDVKPDESEMGVADISNNLGDLYFNEGKYDLAVKSYFLSIKTFEKYNEWYKASITALNISDIYFDKANYPKALEYAKASLNFNHKSKSRYHEGNAYFQLGKIYEESNVLDSAEIYFKKSIQVYDEINHSYAASKSYNSIASLYEKQSKMALAKSYYDKAWEINMNEHDTTGLCVNAMNLSNWAMKQQNVKDAEMYNKKALQMIKPHMGYSVFVDVYGQAADIAGRKKEYQKAYEYLRFYNLYRDSLRNEHTAKQQEELEAIYQNDKKEQQLKLAKAENEAQSLELISAEETSKRKSTQLYASLIGGLLLLVLAGFVIRTNIQRKKTNQLLQEKNLLISQQKEEVEKQSIELAIKNEEIEEKNKEILDSINYAQRIQYALLANDKLLQNNLKQYFILFQPKDIVSGDFYWATKRETAEEELFYLAICDCTGHGVPGAFMSLLNISFLNEAIADKQIIEPNKVLNHVRDKLMEHLSAESGRQDGMDGVLMCFRKNKLSNHTKFTYAAAYNSPMLYRNGELKTLGADKMPIGKGESTTSFKLFEPEVLPDDIIYAYTDGYADQFGGPKGKKFKYKQLEELLISVSDRDMKEQSIMLSEKLTEWKGNLEQVDDILVAGIKI